MKKLLLALFSVLFLTAPEPEPEPEIEKTPEMEEIERLMAEVEQESERYKELDKKYKKLLKDYTRRRPVKEEPEAEPLRPAQEIAHDLVKINHGDVSNREYIRVALEYRNSVLDETGRDVFTDFGPDGPGEPNAKTEKIAKGLQFLLDTYKTDSLFNGQLQEYMKDDLQLLRKIASQRKKAK